MTLQLFDHHQSPQAADMVLYVFKIFHYDIIERQKNMLCQDFHGQRPQCKNQSMTSIECHRKERKEQIVQDALALPNIVIIIIIVVVSRLQFSQTVFVSSFLPVARSVLPHRTFTTHGWSAAAAEKFYLLLQNDEEYIGEAEFLLLY